MEREGERICENFLATTCLEVRGLPFGTQGLSTSAHPTEPCHCSWSFYWNSSFTYAYGVCLFILVESVHNASWLSEGVKAD